MTRPTRVASAWGAAGPALALLLAAPACLDVPAGGSADAGAGGAQGVLVADDFRREESVGWGEPTTGGAWITQPREAVGYSVAGDVGRIEIGAGGDGGAPRNEVGALDVEATMTVALDRVDAGSSVYASIRARDDGADFYGLKVSWFEDGQVKLRASRGDVDFDATLVTVLDDYQAGDRLRARFQVSGSEPATLRGRMWRAADDEPAGWPVAVEDPAPALGPGAVGPSAFLSLGATGVPLVVTVDDFEARTLPAGSD